MKSLINKKYIEKDSQGGFIVPDTARGWAPNYKKAVELYLTTWNELFAEAAERDEFQFILALLRAKILVPPGWDTLENTVDAIDGVDKAARKVDGTRRLNLMLWAYGHIVEASDHYEIIANMVNIAGGQAYRAWNFPKMKVKRGKRERFREQTPNEKILEIRNRCKKLGLKDYTKPFIEVLDKDLRNAVYHSDYSTYMGMVRFRDSEGNDIEYGVDETNLVINRALALHETIKNLFYSYIASYEEPKVIDGSGNLEGLKIQIIVREKYGIMAVQEYPMGLGSFSCGTYRPGEKDKIAKGVFKLPPSETDRLNRFLDRLPMFLARQTLKIYNVFDKYRQPHS